MRSVVVMKLAFYACIESTVARQPKAETAPAKAGAAATATAFLC